tara:strand:- start:410 stop:820 length:411 start_codon:yes stop_codon:yes gene_type:complete
MSQLAACFVCATPGVRYKRDDDDGWAEDHQSACEVLELKGWQSFVFQQPDWDQTKLYLVCPKCAFKMKRNYKNIRWLSKPWLDTNKVPEDLVIDTPQTLEDAELRERIKNLSFDEMVERIRKLARFYKGDESNVDK